MADWSKLEGKKVLVVHIREMYAGPQVETCVVVGCDPDIGICVADIGKEHAPWFVLLGPKAPNYSPFEEDWREQLHLEVMQLVYSQLQSGYISVYMIKEADDKIYQGSGFMASGLSCPFSE